MTIGVALCTYNGNKYIVQQLDSIINQISKPDVIFINDDNSQDGTLEILRDYAKNSEITFDIQSNTDNLGYKRNFENVIQRCNTDIIIPSDQDDFWLPGKIQKLVKPLLESENVMLTCCNSILTDSNLQLMKDTMWDSIGFPQQVRLSGSNKDLFELLLLEHNVISGHAMAFKKELLQIVLPINMGFEWDHWIALNAAVANKVMIVNEALIYYRQHSSNVIGAPSEELNVKMKLLTNDLKKKLANKLQIKNDSGEFIDWRIILREKANDLKNIKLLLNNNLAVEEILQIIDENIEYLKSRYNLPNARIFRILICLRLLYNKTYTRFGRGLLSFGIDLIRK